MLMIGFISTWVALWAAPIAGIMLTRRWLAEGRRKLGRACISAVGLLAMVVLSWRVGLQTASTATNFAFCLAAFSAYWIPAAAAWTLRPKWLGVPLALVAWTPIIPSVLLGTAGLLGLAFILGDYFSPPREAKRMTSSLTCRITEWGMVVADEGYTVHLYRNLPWLPLVRLEVATETVDETDLGAGQNDVNCGSVAARYGY